MANIHHPAGHYINGTNILTDKGVKIPLCSPIDGVQIGELFNATDKVIDEAVRSGLEAWKEWLATPVKSRSQVMFRYKQLLEAYSDELSELIHTESGKLISEAKAGLQKGIEVIEFAASLPHIYAENSLEVSKGVTCQYKRYPLGLTLAITPFNFPAMVPLWMIGLSVGCGNALILKPSEQAALTPLRLAEIFVEAGLPKGIFNVVQGDGQVAGKLALHPEIKAVGFVGSSAVAKNVYMNGTNAGKRVLALGGAKNHLVVMPDADVEMTARNVVDSFTGCAGQRCMAASVLILVGNSDTVLERIIEIAKSLKIGIDIGAIISKIAKSRIEGYIGRAEKNGARVLIDGRNAFVKGCENGNYIGPTIIDNLNPGDECVSDEIFGPVLSVLRTKSLEEAIKIENSNPYGNAAAIYTSSGATAEFFSGKAEAGMVGVNIGVPVPREPFSFGGWNQSKFGIGDITGYQGIDFWTKLKKVTTKWNPNASRNWMS